MPYWRYHFCDFCFKCCCWKWSLEYSDAVNSNESYSAVTECGKLCTRFHSHTNVCCVQL